MDEKTKGAWVVHHMGKLAQVELGLRGEFKGIFGTAARGVLIDAAIDVIAEPVDVESEIDPAAV